jgi:hypothetical protein
LELYALLRLTRPTDNGRPPRIAEERILTAICLYERPVQSPVPAAFMRQGESIAPLNRRAFLGIETFVDDDLACLKPDRAKDVRLGSGPTARDPEQMVQVVEFDVKLQMLLDDVLDRDWGPYRHTSGMRKLRKQGLGVALNGLVRKVGNLKRHFVRSLICIFERKNAITLTLFLLCLLRLSCKPGYVLGAQSFRCSQEIRHFPWTLADDVGQVRRHAPRQGEQLIGITTNDFRDLPHLVLGRRVEIAALNFG